MQVLLRLRYLITFVMVETAVLGDIEGGRRRADWPIFAEGARLLFGVDGFSVLGRHDALVIGPFALVVVRIFDALGGYTAMCLTLGVLAPLIVFLLERSAARVRPTKHLSMAALIGGALLSVAWADLLLYGHPEDAIVLSAAVFAVWCVPDRPISAAVAIGVALCSKPWAVVLLPLLLVFPARRRLVLIAIGFAAAVWLPFVVADHRVVQTATNYIARDSVLGLFGRAGGLCPGWWRAFQLSLALLAASLIARSRRPTSILFVAMSMRVLLDPSTWSYYAAGVVVGALAFDLHRGARVPGWTVAAWLIVFKGHTYLTDGQAAFVRTAFLVAAVAACFWDARQGHRTRTDPQQPMPAAPNDPPNLR